MVTVWLQCGYVPAGLVVTMWLECGCSVVTYRPVWWLQCGYSVVIVWLRTGRSGGYNVVTVWLQCGDVPAGLAHLLEAFRMSRESGGHGIPPHPACGRCRAHVPATCQSHMSKCPPPSRRKRPVRLRVGRPWSTCPPCTTSAPTVSTSEWAKARIWCGTCHIRKVGKGAHLVRYLPDTRRLHVVYMRWLHGG